MTNVTNVPHWEAEEEEFLKRKDTQSPVFDHRERRERQQHEMTCLLLRSWCTDSGGQWTNERLPRFVGHTCSFEARERDARWRLRAARGGLRLANENCPVNEQREEKRNRGESHPARSKTEKGGLHLDRATREVIVGIMYSTWP